MSRKGNIARANIDDEVEICRDEECGIVGIHAIHPVAGLRGRPPKFCPTCVDVDTRERKLLSKRIEDDQLVRYCIHCGFRRP